MTYFIAGYIIIYALLLGVLIEMDEEKSPRATFAALIMAFVWPVTIFVVIGVLFTQVMKKQVSK